MEPISLGLIGGVALTEGVKFLYAQVGDLLKRWRDSRREKQAENGIETLAIDTILPPVLGGQEISTEVSLNYIDANSSELAQLRSRLSNYADDTLEVDPHDPELLTHIDDLRILLEDAFTRRLTFVGELNRPPSGIPIIRGEAKVRDATDVDIAGIEADVIDSNVAIEGTADVQTARGGKITGTRIGRIGNGSNS